MKINNITLGTDPELFLKKDNKIISAIGKIGGSKSEPQPISDDGHFIQEDNVAIEYNIPACKTIEDWVYHHNFVKDYLEVLVAGMGCELAIQASAILDESELDNDIARLAGCEPDFDVWNECINEPADLSATNLRVCGGHISIGWDNPTQEQQLDVVKAMDATVGLKSVLLDSDTQRKSLYGKAGCFRFRNYGIEYRSLSNFWIKTDESLKWAWNTTMKAIDLVNSGKIEEVKELGSYIVEAINTNNKELAQELLNKIEVINNIKTKVTNE
jgi:hypothetical protein